MKILTESPWATDSQLRTLFECSEELWNALMTRSLPWDSNWALLGVVWHLEVWKFPQEIPLAWRRAPAYVKLSTAQLLAGEGSRRPCGQCFSPPKSSPACEPESLGILNNTEAWSHFKSINYESECWRKDRAWITLLYKSCLKASAIPLF